MTSCMDIYEEKIQSDGSIEHLKLGIVVRGYIYNKELVGYTWSPTASMRNLKFLLEDAVKHKAIVYQLDFIGALLQARVKDRIFLNFYSRYAD